MIIFFIFSRESAAEALVSNLCCCLVSRTESRGPRVCVWEGLCSRADSQMDAYNQLGSVTWQLNRWLFRLTEKWANRKFTWWNWKFAAYTNSLLNLSFREFVLQKCIMPLYYIASTFMFWNSLSNWLLFGKCSPLVDARKTVEIETAEIIDLQVFTFLSGIYDAPFASVMLPWT